MAARVENVGVEGFFVTQKWCHFSQVFTKLAVVMRHFIRGNVSWFLIKPPQLNESKHKINKANMVLKFYKNKTKQLLE